MTGDKTEQSFVRRRSTEPFYSVFGGNYLLPPSLYYRNDLVRDFVPSSNCQRWLPVDTWHRRRWIFPVPCLLSGPEGDLAVPDKSDGIELYHPSSIVLCTAWEVLKRLQFNDLYAKAEKCFFEQSSIKYLGVIISENKVQMDEEKLSGVLEWPVPTKVK